MMIEAYLNYLPHGVKALKNRTRIRFHLATQEIMGRIILLEGGELSGGDSGYVQIRLEKPNIARRGDHFVIRSYSPLMTIGGGTVLAPYARKRTTIDSRGRGHLETLRSASTKEIVESLVLECGMLGYPANRLPVDTGVSPAQIGEAMNEISRKDGEIVEIKGELFHRSIFEQMGDKLIESLEAYHKQNPLQQGLKREELRHRVDGIFSLNLMDGVLNCLLDEGKVRVSGGEVKLSSHEIVFRDGVDTLVEEILSILSSEPLSPPDLAKIASQLNIDKGEVLELLSALQNMGKVVKVDESIWLESESVQFARQTIETFLKEREKATASEIRALLNVSRKYVIPILEYMDRIGLTYRKGDFRYLVK
jgi:selenocysteine-specific elongation factor